MSDIQRTEPQRLKSYEIVPMRDDLNTYDLVLRTESGDEFWFVGDHLTFLRLAAAIQKHVLGPYKKK